MSATPEDKEESALEGFASRAGYAVQKGGIAKKPAIPMWQTILRWVAVIPAAMLGLVIAKIVYASATYLAGTDVTVDDMSRTVDFAERAAGGQALLFAIRSRR